MIYKSVSLTFEDFSVDIERDNDSFFSTITIKTFDLDTEKSTPNNDVYKIDQTFEFYANDEEVKEIIKALTEIIPKNEEDL